MQVFGKEESFDPAHRSDRARAGPAAARAARPLLPRRRTGPTRGRSSCRRAATRRSSSSARRRSSRRSLRTALAGPQHVAVLPFADHSAGRRPRLLLPRRAATKSSIAWRSCRRCASSRPPGGGAARGRAEDAGQAAMIIGGSVRRSGDRLRVTRPSHRRRERLLPLVGVGRRGRSATSSPRRSAWPRRSSARSSRAAATPVSVGGPAGRPRTWPRSNLYLQGRYHLNQRTEEGLRKALDFFEKSLVEDAEYAPAHSGLADAYGLLAHYGVLGAGGGLDEGGVAAPRRPCMLDDNSAEAHTSLAHVKATQDWDWAGAEREFQRAIGLEPGVRDRAPLVRRRPASRRSAGSTRRSTRWSSRSRSIRCRRSSRATSAVIHFYRRDFETALEQCDHTIELNPHFAPAYWMLGVHPGAAERLRRVGGGVPARRRTCRRRRRACTARSAARSRSPAAKRALDVLRKLEATPRNATSRRSNSPGPVRARPAGSRLPLAGKAWTIARST